MDDDFGHEYVSGPGFHVDKWGAGPFIIEVDGRSFSFEDSDRFGPYPLKKNGDISDAFWGQRSPFWRSYSAWRKQGRRVKDGKCIWSPGRPTLVRRTGDGLKDFEVVEFGDDLDDFIVIGEDDKP